VASIVVAAPYLNLGGLRTQRYRCGNRLAHSGWPGSLDFNILANFLETYEVQLLQGSPWQQFEGTIDGTQNGGIPLPDWKSLTSLIYKLPKFEGGVRWRHLPEMNDITSVTRPASPAPRS
jgi:hypothetical protein